MIPQIIGVRDLLTRFKEISDRVSRHGQSFLIVKNSKPLLQLTPYYDSEEALDTIVPKDEEHKEIIEAHRQYLRGNYVTGEQVEKMIEEGKL